MRPLSPLKHIAIAATLALLISTQCGAQAMGPLVSITAAEFLKLPEDARVTYVAGVIDGITFTSYGYNLPNHDRYIRCVRTLSLGVLTQRTVDWLRARPSFAEGTASAVSQMLGAYCKEKGLR
jgi:hypothetical protein